MGHSSPSTSVVEQKVRGTQPPAPAPAAIPHTGARGLLVLGQRLKANQQILKNNPTIMNKNTLEKAPVCGNLNVIIGVIGNAEKLHRLPLGRHAKRDCFYALLHICQSFLIQSFYSGNFVLYLVKKQNSCQTPHRKEKYKSFKSRELGIQNAITKSGLHEFCSGGPCSVVEGRRPRVGEKTSDGCLRQRICHYLSGAGHPHSHHTGERHHSRV